MKKKIVTFLILLFATVLSAKANFEMAESADITGDAFFIPSTGIVETSNEKKYTKHEGTMPPIKRLRLNIQNKLDSRAAKNMELAPVKQEEEDIYSVETSTSKYISKEEQEEFEDMTPDGFEADEEAIAEKGKKKLFHSKKNTAKDIDNDNEDIILDCDKVDYDTPNYIIYATGNVNIEFVKQKTNVMCDVLTFDRINSTIKAEGNVRIVKSGRTITGDYIFVDMNEENALIENPNCQMSSVEIKARKGFVYADKIIQEQGEITVSESYPINFLSNRRTARISQMLTPPKESLTGDLENRTITFQADSIKIKQKGDLEVIAIKRGKMSKGKRTILKIPGIKIYTNKNHDYAETNFFEVGNYRGLGLYAGPGWVFELPKGSVLKAVPFINNKSGFGVGALGRFSSGTNQTTAAYSTAASRFFLYGKQELDDNLFMQYSVNSYMDEWFLGRRRPKYGVSMVYKNNYSANGFLLPGRESGFTHRIEAGYFHDLDFDSGHEKIKSSGNMGTTRFRYMAEARQNFFNYKNPEKLKSFQIDFVSQLSAALYGTGDTQTLFRLGPSVRFQYKRWMQDVAYTFNMYDDHTPMAKYDAFRYGTQTLMLREYFRICKWLTVAWYGNICTSNDTINGRRLPENTFYISVGPDDFKLHLGYDFERQVFRTVVEVMMDAKGAKVGYNTFEIKQDKKAHKDNTPAERPVNNKLAPTQPKVLQKAVVENIKVMEDVL